MYKTIAVDFDGTLCADAYPEIGAPNYDVIEALLDEQREGARLTLWTCRCGKLLEDAVAWAAELGLGFDAVNDHLPENREKYGGDARKVFADEYWDDRAVPIVARPLEEFQADSRAAGDVMRLIKVYSQFEANDPEMTQLVDSLGRAHRALMGA